MKSIFAFFAVCFSWSFSWFAIKIQTLSFVSPYVSIFYRCFGAGVIMFLILLLCKQKIKITKSEFKSFVFIGLINGCFNFIFVYKACDYVPSGIVATMSASTVFISEFLMSLYQKRKPNLIILITSITGGIGMYIMFQHNISNQNFDASRFAIGILFCLIANLALSFNYIIVAINHRKHQTNPFLSLAYSAIITGLVILLIGLAIEKQVTFDFNKKYILSLLYLIFFASIIAYSSIYYLNTTIGPAKTGYTALIYTPSSMIISTLFEGWKWHFTGTVGIIIILLSVIFGLKAKEKII